MAIRLQHMTLPLGVLVSTGLHLAVAAGLAHYSAVWASRMALGDPTQLPQLSPPAAATFTPPEAEEAHPEAQKPKPRELRLGLSDAPVADTLTWLGYSEATEHNAPQGRVEQSSLSINPAPPSPNLPGEAAPSPIARAEAAAPADPTPLAPGERTPAGEQAAHESRATTEARPADLMPLARTLGRATDRLVEAISEAVERLPVPPAPSPGPEEGVAALPPPAPLPSPAAASAPPARPEDAAAPAAPAPTAPPAAAQAGQGGGLPGAKSDREAIAVSIRKSPSVTPGQVLATQGLEVRTRAPRFSTVTLFTRSPRNPAVRISFGRTGRVLKAEFVSDGQVLYDTGSEEVNRALLNSIYAWTAKGKALDELSADDPEAAVTLLLTILLR
jgi:hypothetical protein